MYETWSMGTVSKIDPIWPDELIWAEKSAENKMRT